LLGLSLGGMVAFEWARRHREEVAGAVLINTSLGGCSPPWRRLHPSAVLRLVGAMGTVDPAARERIVFALNSNQPELAEATVERWAALARTHAPLRANVLRQVMAAARYRPAVEAVAPPLLILTSRGDHMVDSSCSRVVAGRLPGAVLQVHPTAGHDLPLDDPQWVLTRIAEWLPARRSSEKKKGRASRQMVASEEKRRCTGLLLVCRERSEDRGFAVAMGWHLQANGAKAHAREG